MDNAFKEGENNPDAAVKIYLAVQNKGMRAKREMRNIRQEITIINNE